MASLRSPPTCLSCLRRLSVTPAAAAAAAAAAPWTAATTPTQQTRTKMTKAELEDLQGIPVRLLRDIPSFGRKDAIIRVKPGRMRNMWFPRNAAEYMTRKRFDELGLTESAIGVRDRTFGAKALKVKESAEEKRKRAEADLFGSGLKRKGKETVALPAEEVQTLLQTVLPETLLFARRIQPVQAAVPEPPTPEPAAPAIPRSPSLAPEAFTHADPDTSSSTSPESPSTSTSFDNPLSASSTPQPTTITPIFGSVSKSDVLTQIKALLTAASSETNSIGGVNLEMENIELRGLHAEHDGADRIKHLGKFEVLISPGVSSVSGKPVESVRRVVEVGPEED
ncbi:hypothetical protein F5Y16DRAFT_401868 [Xylariaceae sp. FL0255]|nr:hypothetical protein F5Y16DRAFT_401868 [Xylariaceae sp. FL0255]